MLPQSLSQNERAVAPIFRWAGSKRQLIAALSAQIPVSFERYVEPFAGSAALYWRLLPKTALIADLNVHLIEAYQHIRSNPIELSELLSGLENSADSYYNIRSKFNNLAASIEKSAYFVFLNRFCFNGLFRTNLSGEFNVPYGGLKSGSLPSRADLISYSKLLATTTFECADFQTLIEREAKSGDFFYLDPPFFTKSRRVFRQYDRRSFADKDLDRLAEALRTIDGRGAKFLVSYLDVPEIREIASSWNPTRHRTLRRISGFAKGQKSTIELMFSNYDADAR